MTELQQKLSKDIETILKLIEIAYPDIDPDILQSKKDQINTYPKYTWLCIRINRWFEFAIDNHNASWISDDNLRVFGTIKKSDFKQMKFRFEGIFFVGTQLNESLSDEQKEVRCKKFDRLMRERGYQTPSLEEFWREYHRE